MGFRMGHPSGLARAFCPSSGTEVHNNVHKQPVTKMLNNLVVRCLSCETMCLASTPKRASIHAR
eukprot:6477373-Amphidinium_carterae.1